jgi:hypothetical protein
MASNRACEGAIQPYAEIWPEPFFKLRRCPREEQMDIVHRSRPVHPRQPLPKVVTVPFDRGKQDFGVVPVELSEFDTIGYRAPKHFVLRTTYP